MEGCRVSVQPRLLHSLLTGDTRCHLTIRAKNEDTINLQVELDVISMSYSLPDTGTRHGVACIILNVSLNRAEPWANNGSKSRLNIMSTLLTNCFHQPKHGMDTLASNFNLNVLLGMVKHTLTWSPPSPHAFIHLTSQSCRMCLICSKTTFLIVSLLLRGEEITTAWQQIGGESQWTHFMIPLFIFHNIGIVHLLVKSCLSVTWIMNTCTGFPPNSGSMVNLSSQAYGKHFSFSFHLLFWHISSDWCTKPIMEADPNHPPILVMSEFFFKQLRYFSIHATFVMP